MAWLRVDDTSLTHPKVIRLRSLRCRPTEVVGFVTLCASWSGQHLTDCFIPEALAAQVDPEHWERLAAEAVTVGILIEKVDEHGQPGWLIVNGDGLFHLMSKAEVLLNRSKRNGSRRLAAKIEVLLRDGDMCRYCGHTVTEHDHRSAYGRQIEHVDPLDPHSLLVVSCRACNGRKAKRTPEQAGMTLLPPPGEPFWQPTTLAWLNKYDADPRPSSQLDPAPPGEPSTSPVEAPAAPQQPAGPRTPSASLERPERTRPVPDPPTPAMPPGRDVQGRDGSGQAGQGRGLDPPHPPAAVTGSRNRQARRGAGARTPGGRGVRGKGGGAR